MGKYLGPKKKLERRFGLIKDGAGIAGPAEKKMSVYGRQLNEKQKLKFIYGVREEQLRRFLADAQKKPGEPGLNLLSRLERRLDNVVYRSGWAKTRAQARQFVNHRHVLVDGRKVNIPSYAVTTGEMIALDKGLIENPAVKTAREEKRPVPDWLYLTGFESKVTARPAAASLPRVVDMNTVIEFYSRQ